MKLFTDIEKLLQIREPNENIVAGAAMAYLPGIENAWIAIKDGVIEDFGPMKSLDIQRFKTYEQQSLRNKMVMPSWVDSHTHIVFSEWRNHEFEDRINGMSYQEIADRGGGILNSAAKLSETPEDVLFERAMSRLNKLIQQGTGAIEIKSGYGLSIEAEMKMLRVIQAIKRAAPIPVKSTLLAAHAIPNQFAGRSDDYITEIVDNLLPEVAKSNMADYIDVFCETGYFTVAQMERLLVAGHEHGLRAKVHVNQFSSIGGVYSAVKNNALSVDHLEILSKGDLEALKNSSTIPVALPACSFFLGIPYTPVRELMNNNLPVVLASDFNPGSSPTGNMNFIFSLACIKMNMKPEEAVNAMTLNAAAAIELNQVCGSITKGKVANLIIYESVNGLSFLPYAFGDNHIDSIMVNGEFL